MFDDFFLTFSMIFLNKIWFASVDRKLKINSVKWIQLFDMTDLHFRKHVESMNQLDLVCVFELHPEINDQSFLHNPEFAMEIEYSRDLPPFAWFDLAVSVNAVVDLDPIFLLLDPSLVSMNEMFVVVLANLNNNVKWRISYLKTFDFFRSIAACNEHKTYLVANRPELVVELLEPACSWRDQHHWLDELAG